MDTDRWQRISRLYHEALERPADQRDAFLDTGCQGDDVLRGRLRLSSWMKFAGEMLDAPDELEPGIHLGTYRIERALGRGGMGLVFLAHDATLRRPVALKVLGAPTNDETARARLVREARRAAALNHPDICTVYEVGPADGRSFIAMEYVDGRTLSDMLAESALQVEQVVRYGMQAADALAYAHDHGVIHRDLKAANAIVTTFGD